MIDPQIFPYLLLFIIPAYVANSTPVILGGVFAIDGGRNFFDSKRILGKGKTWFGLFGGFFCGVLSSILLAYILSGTSFDLFGAKFSYYLLCGIALSSGALFGDIIGSFIKRRFSTKHGHPALFLDQLTFLIGALAFCYPLGLTIVFAPQNLAFLIFTTYFIHRAANFGAYNLRLKKVPW